MNSTKGASLAGEPASGVRPQVSLIVVAWQHQAMLDRCLAAAAAALATVSHETIVLDNGSRPALARCVPSATWVRHHSNVGFARAANTGARLAHGRYLLFLNSDAELAATTVHRLSMILAADRGLAAVAPLARGAAGDVRFPGLRFLGPLNQTLELLLGRLAGRFGRSCRPRRRRGPLVDVDWLRGSVLLVRAECFRAVCGFDEGYFFYEEDEDLCWRLRRRGYRVAVDTTETVYDPGGGSTASAGRWPRVELFRGQRRFVAKRFGHAGEWVYRCLASLAFLGKIARHALHASSGWRHEAFADALRGLWTSASQRARTTVE